MTRKTGIPILAIAICIASISASAQTKLFEGMSYLDNGEIRIGVDLDIGGAITHLSKSSGENIVNSYDWGRQIQMSFFSGPKPFEPNGKEPHPYWKFIGWNPIQSGDVYKNQSKVITHRNDGKSLYLKCIPMHWPLDNEPGECTFEVWITLDGNSVNVRSKLNNARSDKTQYKARNQELPALYSNGTYYRLYTYDGVKPFTGDAIRQITKVWDSRQKPNEVPGGPWDNWIATENWAALVNDDDQGFGIWTPGTYHFIGGFAGKPGKGGPKDAPTGYIAPIGKETLDHNIAYEYAYTLIVGDLDEIRSYVYEHAEPTVAPDYNFRRDRESWTLRDGTDEGWQLDGKWRVQCTGANTVLVGPKSFWQADRVPTMYVQAAFDTGVDTAILQWEGYGDSPSDSIKFDVISDGKMHTYLIELNGHENYKGAYTRFSLVAKSDGSEGRSVVVDRISFRAGD